MQEVVWDWQKSCVHIAATFHSLTKYKDIRYTAIVLLIIGRTRLNRNSFEFKFDDTRLSSYIIKIGPINFFLLLPDFAKSLPCWLRQSKGYHQIWFQNYFGFIVSDLVYIHTYQYENSSRSYMDNLNHRIMIKGAKAQQHDMKLPYSMAPYTYCLLCIWVFFLQLLSPMGCNKTKAVKHSIHCFCQINQKTRITVPIGVECISDMNDEFSAIHVWL